MEIRFECEFKGVNAEFGHRHAVAFLRQALLVDT
jgi:hypothetical protein